MLLALAFIGQFICVATPWTAIAALAAWGALLRYRTISRAAVAASILVAAATVGYLVQRPSHEREWKPEVAHLPKIEIDGDALRIANLRDFNWRSTNDFDPRWIDASYDLNQLDSLDVIVVPFADSERLAHVMLSFGFADGRHLSLSVEARPENGESYSLMGGAARQLELIYLFGAERDLLGLRILHRGDRVYCFPMKASPRFMRELLTELCASANQLHDQPSFYATLRHNCTTTLLRHVNRIHERPIRFQREILFPAQLGQLLHRIDTLDTTLDWPAAKERFRVDERIRAATDLTQFSKTLRSER